MFLVGFKRSSFHHGFLGHEIIPQAIFEGFPKTAPPVFGDCGGLVVIMMGLVSLMFDCSFFNFVWKMMP